MSKFTSYDNLKYFWSKAKSYIDAADTTNSSAVSAITKSSLGLGNVDNTSDANKPVSTATQTALNKKQDKLVSGTSIKTINGTSLLGSGDVTIDLTLYKVVTSLPTTGVDTNKIYLVLTEQNDSASKYAEYVYVNSAWEKIGEYVAEISVDDAMSNTSTNPVQNKVLKSYIDAKVTASGTFSEADSTKLNGIEEGAEVNVIETVKVNGTALTVTDKAVNVDLSGKQDKLTAGTNITISGTTISAKDTTYSAATTSAAGLMSASDKSKLDAIAAGATKVTVDDALSSTSTNPVQNKILNSALAGKQSTLTAGTNITISGNTISAKDTVYTLPAATSSALGGVKVGYTTSGKNYAVKLDSSNNAYVNVPWTDNNTTYNVATASANGLMSSTDYSKLAGIAAGATADSALTEDEIDTIFA